MSEMVERVARAIAGAPQVFWRLNKMRDGDQYEVFLEHEDRAPSDPIVLKRFSLMDSAVSYVNRWNIESKAECAIEAMREPTQQMIARATDQMDNIVSPNHAAIAWQLLIDAAINEGK